LAGTLVDKQGELRQIEQEIHLIDVAISMLPAPKKLIIDLKYMQGNKDIYVQRVLKKKHGIKSRDSYYRYKDEAVGELAKMLGEEKGEK